MTTEQELFPSVDTSGFSDIDVEYFNARFATTPKFNEGKTPVLLVDQRDENGTVREDQILNIGFQGLKIVDGGARVEYENKKYNTGVPGLPSNSDAANLVSTLVALDREAFVGKMESGIGPCDARFWERLSFHLENEEVERGKKDPETGERKKFRRPIATAFYGWNGIPEGGGVVGQGDSTTPISNERKDLEEDRQDLSTVDPAVIEKLTALAKEHGSFTDFVAAAYDLDEISDSAVQEIVDNEAAYKQLRK